MPQSRVERALRQDAFRRLKYLLFWASTEKQKNAVLFSNTVSFNLDLAAAESSKFYFPSGYDKCFKRIRVVGHD
jgi:hypothetical protein